MLPEQSEVSASDSLDEMADVIRGVGKCIGAMTDVMDSLPDVNNGYMIVSMRNSIRQVEKIREDLCLILGEKYLQRGE